MFQKKLKFFSKKAFHEWIIIEVIFSFLRNSRSSSSSSLFELTKPLFSIIYLHFVDKYRVIY